MGAPENFLTSLESTNQPSTTPRIKAKDLVDADAFRLINFHVQERRSAPFFALANSSRDVFKLFYAKWVIEEIGNRLVAPEIAGRVEELREKVAQLNAMTK